MKRVGTFAAIAFGSAAVLAAQGTPGQTPQPQPGRSGGATDTRPAQSSQSGTVTLTGCLQREGGAAGGAGSSSASGASSQSAASYILADATMGSGSASGSSGAAGTTGSSAAGAAGTSGSSAAAGRSGSTYMLDGSASELSSHVNKRVQVTGTMAAGSSSGAGSSGAGTPGAGTPGATASSSGAGASAGGQHFKVTSVKEVGGDCSPSASSPR